MIACESLRCGSYEVFENRQERSGRKIKLHIVMAPSFSMQPQPDPVFVIVGGPGGSAAELAGRTPQFDKLRARRDIVFVDQRGTGLSNGLQCDLYGNTIQGHFTELFPVDAVRRCRDTLAKSADLAMYTTPIAMDDLDEVRRAMGYSKINLYGVSYGTWAAMEYLRTHADSVRTATLAGTASVGAKFPLQFAKGAQSALEDLFRDCAADESCNARFPDLRNEFETILKTLRERTAEFQIEGESVSLTYHAFTERLRLMLYDLGSASRVPVVIHAAASGNWIPFAAAVLNRSRQTSPLAAGMYFTVSCSESVPTITDADIERESSGTFVGDFRTRVHQRACAEWPRATIPPEFYQPLRTDVPVLMLAGDLDPATPPQFAREAAKTLPNGRVVRIRNAAHGYGSNCLQEIVEGFVTAGSAKELDSSCVESMRRPPFY
jgi:pimeloyl-ACP methyl ester carboxylesterase